MDGVELITIDKIQIKVWLEDRDKGSTEDILDDVNGCIQLGILVREMFISQHQYIETVKRWYEQLQHCQ